MIRHAERADLVKNKANAGNIEEKDDPHLTLGIKQANELGDHIVKTLEGLGVKRIVIESSPWLRCMQTASCIVRELKKNYLFEEH